MSNWPESSVKFSLQGRGKIWQILQTQLLKENQGSRLKRKAQFQIHQIHIKCLFCFLFQEIILIQKKTLLQFFLEKSLELFNTRASLLPSIEWLELVRRQEMKCQNNEMNNLNVFFSVFFFLPLKSHLKRQFFWISYKNYLQTQTDREFSPNNRSWFLEANHILWFFE